VDLEETPRTKQATGEQAGEKQQNNEKRVNRQAKNTKT
jgi:hypothetical protein